MCTGILTILSCVSPQKNSRWLDKLRKTLLIVCKNIPDKMKKDDKESRSTFNQTNTMTSTNILDVSRPSADVNMGVSPARPWYNNAVTADMSLNVSSGPIGGTTDVWGRSDMPTQDYPMLANSHHLVTTTTSTPSVHHAAAAAVATLMSKETPNVRAQVPSRQSYVCPLCGRRICERRTLKRHLMTHKHRLSAAEAENVIKECLAFNGR